MDNDTLWSESSHDAFIGSYKNAVDKEFCDDLISFFENSREDSEFSPGFYTSEKKYGGPLNRKDFSLNLDQISDTKWADHINDVLFKCLEEYKRVFFVAAQIDHLNYCNTYVKMQRTFPKGGYHLWHCEITDISCVDRCLAWILYLNDIPYGEGETEFLWQGMRVQPEAGKLVIWPAQFTHTHRGNPVHSKAKYIATGWIEYSDVRKNHPDSPVIFDQENDYAISKKNRVDKRGSKEVSHALEAPYDLTIPQDLDILSVDFGDRTI
jgi:hypothetical protein